jgi:hypothetical protein
MTSLINFFRKSTSEPKLKQKKYGILLIDMQSKFIGKIEYEDRSTLLSKQTEVLNFCAYKSVSCILIEYRDSGDTHPILYNSFNEFPLGLKTKIVKSLDNAFQFTYLHSYLKRNEITDLFLMGVNASVCVKDTAKSALNRGFKISTSLDVIKDAGRESIRDISFYKKSVTLYTSYTGFLKEVDSIQNSFF